MSSLRTSSGLSFRMAVIALMLAMTIAAPGVVAEANLVTMRKENERAGHASTALREYLVLEAMGDAVERRMATGGVATPGQRRAALSALDAQLDRIDRATSHEITLIGSEGFATANREALITEERLQEIDTRHLRASFARMVTQTAPAWPGPGGDWRAIVRHGIENEQLEVRAAQVRAVDALERTQVAFFATAALLVLGGLGLMAWTRANVLDPLQRLLDSTRRVAQRDFAMNLPDRGPREFRLLNRAFNAMTAETERAQARLEAANHDLEDEVRQRTADLLAANASLRALDHHRRNFIAAAGHELRTPIAVLRSDAEVALRDRAPTLDALRASLKRIVRSAGTLGRLIEDMLRVARADAPVLSYERETVDLDTLVASALADFRPVVEADGGTVSLTGIGRPLPVRVDPLRIGQVLRIVFDNAVKHGSEEPCICVTLALQAHEAVVEIADCGDGIAPDLLPHLFDRTRWPRRRDEDGHGLGLTIAATIMEAHGGRIEVRSQAGMGAVVTLRLPCAMDGADPQETGEGDHNALADC